MHAKHQGNDNIMHLVKPDAFTVNSYAVAAPAADLVELVTLKLRYEV